jgi:hypothetical protein
MLVGEVVVRKLCVVVRRLFMLGLGPLVRSHLDYIFALGERESTLARFLPCSHLRFSFCPDEGLPPNNDQDRSEWNSVDYSVSVAALPVLGTYLGTIELLPKKPSSFYLEPVAACAFWREKICVRASSESKELNRLLKGYGIVHLAPSQDPGSASAPRRHKMMFFLMLHSYQS